MVEVRTRFVTWSAVLRVPVRVRPSAVRTRICSVGGWGLVWGVMGCGMGV